MKRYVRWQSLLLLGCVQVLACLAYTNTHHIRNSNPTITSAMKPLRRRSSFLQMASNDEVEFQQYLQRDDFESAFRILKRNPMIPVAPEYACKLLNHLDRLEDVSKAEDSQQKMAESNVFLYRRLERQKVLRGFNCIDGEYPENSMDITPAKLEEVSGISVTSLTPKQRTTYWQLAGIGLCLSEYIFGTSIGIDPLFTLIPATFFLFGSDQVFFKGAFFETLYRSLFPEYKQKVICHEAGHFLIAYLLGIPIRACITNAWDARKYPEIRGPAGTIFYDNRMAEELQKGQVARSSLDRLSIALMAGIAAEAVTFNVCEGGVADEQSLVSLFAPLQPAWNIIRIQGQARWAVLQAILLIREHKGAFDAVVKGLEENKSVGDIIFDLEQQLPKELPSQKRIRERNLRNKQRESNFLLRFIQNKTWMVGGIQEGEGKEEESPSEEKTVSHQEAVSVAPGEDIAIKMDHLEQAVTNGDIDISQAKEGGIWLNGLQTYNSPTSSSSTVSSGSNDDFIRTPAKVALPSPKEGYEQVVEKFLKKEDQEKEDENSQNWTPRTMLTSHRGYQMKELELEQARKANKTEEITTKLQELRAILSSKTSSTPRY